MENVKREKALPVMRSPFNRDQLLTAGDLFDFKLELMFEIKTLLKEQNGQTAKKWLKSREVRKLLGISPGTLQNLRVKKILPFTRIGGIIYHDAADIQAMLESKKLEGNTRQIPG
jgi:hypothetical protein